MPLPKPKDGEDRDSFINRCMSNPTVKKEFTDQKQRTAVCFSQWKKGTESCSRNYSQKEGGKGMIKENVELKFGVPIAEVLTEGQNSKNSRKVRGTMLKATTSRNGVTYLMEEIQKTIFSADTVSINHTEDVMDNVGTFVPTITSDGIQFEGVIHNTDRHPGVTSMLDNKLIKFVSIEAIAEQLEKDKSSENFIARGLEITGLGFVKTPGIKEATVAIAEAFNKDDVKEDSGGKIMTEELTKETTETPTEETTEEPKEETPVEEPKEEAPSEEEKTEEKPAEEATEALKAEIKSLKEGFKTLKKSVSESKSKGTVIKKTEETVPLVKEKNRDGSINFYAKEAREFY